MNILVIANPIAGGGQGEATARELVRALEDRGAHADLVVTRGSGDAQRAAARPGYDCVAVVGGDGTANEAVNGLPGPDVPLAILPLGTANVVAREFQLPRKPAAVADRIVAGGTQAIDTGVSGGRKFLLGAGAGFDAAVVNVIHANRGKRLGLLAWVVPTIRLAFTYTPNPIKVTVDGEVVAADAHYVIVGNCRYTAGIFPFTPKARTGDGLLDVCIVRRYAVRTLAWMVVRCFLPGYESMRSLTYVQGAAVELESASGVDVPVQIDGDPAGVLPVRFGVAPRGLALVR